MIQSGTATGNSSPEIGRTFSADPERAKPNNLPLPLSSFVGRGEALHKVRQLVASTRLLTLTGPGGVGKTRLALQAAFDLLDNFDDGIWWVDLAPVSEPGLVAYIVALALGLPDDPARSKVEILGEHLQDKDLLLVIDNCEHLIGECATMAGWLLSTVPSLRILAASREPLGIDGEIVWPVPPLSLPCLDGRIAPSTVTESEAGQLFLERVRAIRPGFQLTGTVARSVAQVCCRLEGIPLAIELAAARVQVLSVSQIAEHLDDVFALLTEGRRTALPRHQTLEATIQWSYDLLTRPEQKLFERLGVFSAFSLEAAQAVAGDPGGNDPVPPDQVLDLLSSLVSKSLVLVREDERLRYSMLDTIRRYAWQRLAASGELAQVRQRHLAYYLEVAERAESELMGRDQLQWLRLLEAKHDDLRAALTWSQESGAGEAGLRLAAALASFWIRVGHLSEGSDWLERALGACREAGPLRSKALYQAGRLAQRRGNYDQALVFARQCLALGRRLGDKKGIARALGLMGWIAHARGERDGAGPLLEDSLALARESGDQRTVAQTLLFLGDLRLRQGSPAEAATFFQESLEFYETVADSWCLAWAQGGLGDVARLQGDHRQALARLQLALALYQESDSRSEIPFVLEALALAAAAGEQPGPATRLWAAASALREAVHSPLPAAYEADYAPALEKLRTRLGDEAYAAAWAEGRAMTLKQALALASELSAPAEPEPRQPVEVTDGSPEAQGQAGDVGLTPRETEVLRLLASGLTDAEIAEELVISPRTVGKHVQSIYGKLDLHTRSAATRWALEHRLG
jgi:predicted ATPase/DNA-binding CsgD family transcriptional regulator